MERPRAFVALQGAITTLWAMPAQIVVNPANDAQFVRTVRELAGREHSRHAFEAKLRTRYPSAAVRHSELSGEAGERWYVYRDGRWAGDGMASSESAS